MLKNFPYRRTLLLLVIVAAASMWQIYAGWAPLLAWLVLILAQMGIMALLIVGNKTMATATSASKAVSATGTPASLVQAIEYVNTQTDTTGQPTPRLPAGLSSVVGARSSVLASQVRAYASVDDAKSYGWSFSEEIGLFNETPIFKVAELEGKTWEYDGLTSESLTSSIPSDRRVFGRLRYHETCEQAQAQSSESTLVETGPGSLPHLQSKSSGSEVHEVKAS